MAEINTNRRHAPATVRNRDSILAVLKQFLPETGTVLEIACGSGEHVSYFAPHFPGLMWQPTDLDQDNFDSIRSWSRDANGNVLEPLYLDTRDQPWPIQSAAAILCMNMVHISPWATTEGLLSDAGSVLEDGGVLYIYGPFKQSSVPFAPSNMAFDNFLQNQNPAWGIRDLSAMESLAHEHDLTLENVLDMPANNLSVIFRKGR